jgi:hypothetical protein
MPSSLSRVLLRRFRSEGDSESTAGTLEALSMQGGNAESPIHVAYIVIPPRESYRQPLPAAATGVVVINNQPASESHPASFPSFAPFSVPIGEVGYARGFGQAFNGVLLVPLKSSAEPSKSPVEPNFYSPSHSGL